MWWQNSKSNHQIYGKPHFPYRTGIVYKHKNPGIFKGSVLYGNKVTDKKINYVCEEVNGKPSVYRLKLQKTLRV